MTEGERMVLSSREYVALDCLREVLWAQAVQIGTEVYNAVNRIDGGGSNLSAIGSAILGRLRKRGLVTKIQPEGLWRITPPAAAPWKKETDVETTGR